MFVQFLRIKMFLFPNPMFFKSQAFVCCHDFFHAGKYLWEPSGNLKQANRQSQVFRHGDSYCHLFLLLSPSHLCKKESFLNCKMWPRSGRQSKLPLIWSFQRFMGDLKVSTAPYNSCLWVWADIKMSLIASVIFSWQTDSLKPKLDTSICIHISRISAFVWHIAKEWQ